MLPVASDDDDGSWVIEIDFGIGNEMQSRLDILQFQPKVQITLPTCLEVTAQEL